MENESITPINQVQELVNRGNINYDEKKYLVAIQYYSEAYQMTKDEKICFKLVECHFQLNQYMESLAYIDKIQQDSNNPQVIKMKGLALYNLDQIDASEKVLQIANKLLPNDEAIQEKYFIVRQTQNIYQLLCKEHEEKISQFNIIKNIPLYQRLTCQYCQGYQSRISVKAGFEAIAKKDQMSLETVKEIELYIQKQQKLYCQNFQKLFEIIQQVNNTIIESQKTIQANFELIISVTKQFRKISIDNNFTSTSSICLAELISQNEKETKLYNIKELINSLNNQTFQNCQTYIQNILDQMEFDFQDEQSLLIPINDVSFEHPTNLKQFQGFAQIPQSFAHFNSDQTKIFLVQRNQIKLIDIRKRERPYIFEDNIIKAITQFTIRLDENIFIAAETNGFCILWTKNNNSEYKSTIISSSWKYNGIEVDQTKNKQRFYSWRYEKIMIWQKTQKWECFTHISTNPNEGISAFASCNMNMFAFGEKSLNLVEVYQEPYKTVHYSRSPQFPPIAQIQLINKSSQNSEITLICLIFDKENNIELWKQQKNGNLIKYFNFKVNFEEPVTFVELKENYLISVYKDSIYLFQFDLYDPLTNHRNLKCKFQISSDINSEISQISSIAKSNAQHVFYLSYHHSLLIPISKFEPVKNKSK